MISVTGIVAAGCIFPVEVLIKTSPSVGSGNPETLDSIRFASDLAIDAATSVSGLPDPTDGEVFIKTSTGKIQPAATMPVTLIMLEAIRDHFLATGLRIGMKPAVAAMRKIANGTTPVATTFQLPIEL